MNISGVFPLPPLGLASMAAVLERDGVDVRIVDMTALKINAGDIAGHVDPQDAVVGISCNIFTLGLGVDIARKIKKSFPSIVVVLGGRCASFPPLAIMQRYECFDVLVTDEGENAIAGICRIVKDGGRDFSSVCGIVCRMADGKLVQTEKGNLPDIATLPFPARHLLPHHKYRLHPPFGLFPPVTLMETSRGCHFKCAFCTLPRPVRQRSAQQIVDEIKLVQKDYGVREVHFVDTNFTFNRKRIMEFCHLVLSCGVKVHWTCKTRVDLVDLEMLDAMAKAGCYMISFGVESGSQKVLDAINKGITVAQIHEAFANCAKTGIRTLAYMLLGSPQETEETIKESITLVKKIRPDFVLYGRLMPDPNADMIKNQLVGNQSMSDHLFDLYDKDSDVLFSADNSCALSDEQLDYWLGVANKSFYVNPAYILRRLLALKNPRELWIMASGVFFMLADKLKNSLKVS